MVHGAYLADLEDAGDDVPVQGFLHHCNRNGAIYKLTIKLTGPELRVILK